MTMWNISLSVASDVCNEESLVRQCFFELLETGDFSWRWNSKVGVVSQNQQAANLDGSLSRLLSEVERVRSSDFYDPSFVYVVHVWSECEREQNNIFLSSNLIEKMAALNVEFSLSIYCVNK